MADPKEIQATLLEFDAVVSRYADAADLESRERIAYALTDKLVFLREHDQKERAAEVCDELLERFGRAGEGVLREHVAYALFTKGELLELLVRHPEAVAAYTALIRHFREGESPKIDETLEHARRRRQKLMRSKRWDSGTGGG